MSLDEKKNLVGVAFLFPKHLPANAASLASSIGQKPLHFPFILS